MNNEEQKAEILKFLQNQYLMHIATCGHVQPAASIMLYAIDEHFHIFFTTHRNAYKAQNLLRNPKIGIAIWKPQERLVQIDGETDEVTDPEKQTQIMDKLADSAAQDINFWPPVFRITGDSYIIFEVTPTWIRSLDLSRNTITQETSPFTELQI